MTSKAIVIFGAATGDLCKKKLIPALYKLWLKDLLPENFLIVGSARREFTSEMWKESLGYYPEEFMHLLDYVPSDLSDQLRLRTLDAIADDVTYFLSVPPSRYEDAIINLSEAGKLDDPERSRVVVENPLGTTLNLLIIYSLWFSDIYARNKYIALTIISAKILFLISLLLGLATLFLKRTLEPQLHRRSSDLCYRGYRM